MKKSAILGVILLLSGSEALGLSFAGHGERCSPSGGGYTFCKDGLHCRPYCNPSAGEKASVTVWDTNDMGDEVGKCAYHSDDCWCHGSRVCKVKS